MKNYSILVSLIVLLFFVSVIAVGTGPFKVSPVQVIGILLSKIGIAFSGFTSAQESVVINIRIPRIILAVLVGCSLAVSGGALQGLFRNPLVDPGLIGVSSGAAVAVASMVIFGKPLMKVIPEFMGLYILAVAAFCGGITASFIVLKMSEMTGRANVMNMILSGIAINSIAVAGIGLLNFLSNDQQMRTITFWSLGSLGGATWLSLMVISPFIIGMTYLTVRKARELNVLALGEREAGHLGINIEKLKKQVVLISAISVGAAVSVSGIIGFLGLVVPHLARLIIGPDHRALIPISALLGAILMIISDIFARMIVSPAELPIGILTSLIGGPFFIFLILKNSRLFKI